jgi:uncharacterized membrane protein YdjX (TVP38/TMEM64 family)
MKKPYFRFLVLILLIIFLFLLGKSVSLDKEKISKILKSTPLRIYSSIIFVLLYTVGTFFIWYLKDPLKLIGAILFGPYLSTLLIYISETINAYIFFHLSNFLGKEFVEKKLKGRFKKFYEKLEDINLGWIFLLRAVPLIPYRILDLTFGLTKLSFKKYLLVVLLASPPRIFWLQFILSGVKELSINKIMLYFVENRFIFVLSLLYFIFAIIVAFKLKKKLK